MEGHATVFFKQRNDVNVRQTRDCDQAGGRRPVKKRPKEPLDEGKAKATPIISPISKERLEEGRAEESGWSGGHCMLLLSNDQRAITILNRIAGCTNNNQHTDEFAAGSNLGDPRVAGITNDFGLA